MVIIGLIAIAVLFLSIICLKHDLDKKREKLLDEMTKKTTEKCQSRKKIGADTQRIGKRYATNITTGK